MCECSRMTTRKEIGDHELFGTFDLAKMWRVSQATVRRWAKAGQLRACHPDWAKGHLRVTGREVKRFIDEELRKGQ